MKKYEVYYNHSVKEFNTFRIGGKAKYLVIVYDIDTLHRVCIDCCTHNIKYKVIGLGANLLFADSDYDGAIIVNRSDSVRTDKDTIIADSGVAMAGLINFATEHSLSGLENFVGIPSTLGGAIVNNLGSNGEISELIESVVCFKRNSPTELITLQQGECQFKYRDSIFKGNEYVIISATLRLKSDIYHEIKKRTIAFLHKKLSTQPLNEYSAGSVFKRCHLIPSKIIDGLGLKGYTIGGAQVSNKHAGFIINTGSASAQDVLNLVKHINSMVYDKYGITFSPEIELVE